MKTKLKCVDKRNVIQSKWTHWILNGNKLQPTKALHFINNVKKTKEVKQFCVKNERSTQKGLHF